MCFAMNHIWKSPEAFKSHLGEFATAEGYKTPDSIALNT